MRKIIAFCIDESLFLNNRIMDKVWSSKFPGAYWISLLNEKLLKEGFCFVTGDVALDNVKTGFWKATDISIIQHDISHFADTLLSSGCKPLALCCYESPMYAFNFYNKIHDLAKVYPNRVLFKGGIDLIDDLSGNNHYIRFPNYDISTVSDLVSWDNRKNIVVVSSNKYEGTIKKSERIYKFLVNSPNPIRVFKIIQNRLSKKHKKKEETFYPLSKQLNQDGVGSLHNKRLEVMEFLFANGMLDLFGKGWKTIDNLPFEWQKRLSTYIISDKDYTCDIKTKTISQYKFCLCMENYSYPGYVTEKIIDCFVAGVIPIYCGAPDISDIIPSDTYINIKDFDSLDILLEHIRSIGKQEGTEIILRGRDFLRSSEGSMFTYKYTSELYYKMIMSSIEG